MSDPVVLDAVNIPRYLTAIAEWLGCMVYIFLFPEHRKHWQSLIPSFLMLPILIVYFVLTESLPLIFWIPCMVLAVLMMAATILFACDMNSLTSFYVVARAFLLAEFAASLEWQVYYYIVFRVQGDVLSLRILYAVIFYTLIFGGMFLMEKRTAHGHFDQVENLRDLLPSIAVVVIAFAVSNLSFVFSDTPFSSSLDTDIYNIRTLADLSGLVALFAIHSQRNDMHRRYEVETLNQLLENQYAQYRLSRESIDLINRKHHDLKHQIAILREQAASGDVSELDRMEEEIRSYEAQNKTGNDVLDTVLTARAMICSSSRIRFTCVADGELLSFMETMDLCSLFGNALDNAIEYERTVPEEKRLIRLSVSRVKGFVMIRVSNYFEGTLRLVGGLPRTTKRDERFHGYGVKSIRATAEKYGGSMAITQENDSFNLQVLLPIR